ncbi:ytkA-like family protein [Lyngbya aestuarii BL J]|uniref:YtkA-like family protein n=1 Tax=Lyngbya aestuarii BL J TaxID=1348334 RepID=U7QDK6_9CYAN|nr:hypothetical protein [Lyngbya aestuarii]ERT05903.1 ytkA-like family protein [Lyngbya aestuarii BL J]
MNRFLISLFAVPSLLTLIQSCAVNSPSKDASTQAQQTHQMNHNSGDNLSAHHQSSTHSHSNHSSESASLTKAQLTKPSQIAVNQPQTFLIEIQDKTGKPITDFETFQEQLMHLIVVSEDLDVFEHLHPEYDGDGLFQVEITFPKPGSYTLVTDYKPSRMSEEITLLNAQVPGVQLTSSVKINENMSQILEDTQITLTSSQPVLQSGQEVTLKFNLKDAKTNQPINDLKPYLGEQGHLVIFKQSNPLTKADYIHAHALKNTPPDEVHFMTNFPKPGTYKVWGQFNRNGKIITSSFWVKVS